MFFLPRVNPLFVVVFIAVVILAFALGAPGVVRVLSFGALGLYVLAWLAGDLWSDGDDK